MAGNDRPGAGGRGGGAVRAARAAVVQAGGGAPAEPPGAARALAFLEHLGALRLRADVAGGLPHPSRAADRRPRRGRCGGRSGSRRRGQCGDGAGRPGRAGLRHRPAGTHGARRRCASWCRSPPSPCSARAEAPLVVYGACAVYGFSVGNNITLSPLIVQREYAAPEFPAIVALSTAVVQILYAFGPGLLGILRDAFGGYGVPLARLHGAEPRGVGDDPDAPAPGASLRNFRLFTTLSMVLRGPVHADADEIQRIGRSGRQRGAVVGVVGGPEHGFDVDRRHQLARQRPLVGAAQLLERGAIDEHRLADQARYRPARRRRGRARPSCGRACRSGRRPGRLRHWRPARRRGRGAGSGRSWCRRSSRPISGIVGPPVLKVCA